MHGRVRPPSVVAQRERIVTAFARRLREDSAAAWQWKLDAAGVPSGVVKSVLDVVRDVDASAVTGMPSSIGGSVRFPPPDLDEHGAAIRDRGWEAFLLRER